MISKDEQAKRFHERIEDKTKNWKFQRRRHKRARILGRIYGAYDDMIEKCSTAWAPWYVIPSNRKWFRNYAVSEIVCSAIEGMESSIRKRPRSLENQVRMNTRACLTEVTNFNYCKRAEIRRNSFVRMVASWLNTRSV